MSTAPAQPTTRAGLLWTYSDAASITQSVALGANGSESWVGHWLNDKRMSKFTTAGAGTPDFVYSLSGDNPDSIVVSAAESTSLCAVLSWKTGSTVTLRGFSNGGGATPLWTYSFPAAYTNSGAHGVSVNDDGTRVAACAYDGANTLLNILDGTSNTVLVSASIAGYCSGVELSGDGSRVVVTAGDTARLYDTATLTEIYSLQTSGAGGFHRISRDGTAIACGGFNIRAAREIGGVWQQVYAAGGSNDWFGYGIGLSGDGETLFVVSHDYAQNYLPNDHQIIDLTTGSVIATWSYTGTGSFQNTVVGAQVNDDGTVFACASWGDEGNTQPEVRIFDRSLNMIGSIDSEGSPFDVQMSHDGHYVLVGSKAVHANTFGNGGRTYAYENETACYGDFNGDGVVDTRDVTAFLNAWTSQNASADCDGNGVIDTRDVTCFLNAWTAGC
ncbi:MAG: hypothetical protein IPJ41_00345 [Phycisphaerales bacterium]|nr:hypothetical protein [Phycisphaerales bacterium]